MKFRFFAPLFVCAALSLAAGEAKHYGQPMTLKTETKISEILASPEKFKGKRVRIRGTVTNVCEERGCYLNIKGDKKFQELMFKVDDGVIVFPASALGREAVAEGTVDILVFSEKEQKEMCPVEAKALNRKFDPAKIKGPLTVVRLNGLGADITS
ncbi:MAG: DUF4920 domain-containing protein [Holophaga sp.]